MNQFLSYAQGYNLTNRMPLWVRPNRSITVNESMNAMRDHFESACCGHWPAPTLVQPAYSARAQTRGSTSATMSALAPGTCPTAGAR
jgi:hypothetical protein